MIYQWVHMVTCVAMTVAYSFIAWNAEFYRTSAILGWSVAAIFGVWSISTVVEIRAAMKPTKKRAMSEWELWSDTRRPDVLPPL